MTSAVRATSFSVSLVPIPGWARAQQIVPAMPMRPVQQDGAAWRQLQKKVFDTRPLDGMEDLAHWSFKGGGSMTLSTARVKQGRYSLRIASADDIGSVDGKGDWLDLVATRA